MVTPLERMIDEACGYDPSVKRVAMISLRCPKCKVSKDAPLHVLDPEGTVTIEYACPRCRKEGDGSKWFDADGNELHIK